MKGKLKKLVAFVAILLSLPFIITFFVGKIFFDENQLFSTISQYLSLVPGKLGSYCRKGFYSLAMTHCDLECAIGFGTLFSQKDTEIHKGVYIGPQCNIGKSRIEKNCLFGSGVHILSGKQQHNFSDMETPIQQQGGTFQLITIGEDTWIGNGAIVMANVGKKCVVGAGSVVIDDVPDYSIVAGNPAKLIKARV